MSLVFVFSEKYSFHVAKVAEYYAKFHESNLKSDLSWLKKRYNLSYSENYKIFMFTIRRSVDMGLVKRSYETI